MMAIVTWIACSPLIGCVVARLIGAGMRDRAAPRCTQACNQGRSCTCR